MAEDSRSALATNQQIVELSGGWPRFPRKNPQQIAAAHNLGQGWRTVLRASAQNVYKSRKNSFACPWEGHNEALEYSIIIINYYIIMNY
jgi:hypothetical protein